jgi:hypothetical protein
MTRRRAICWRNREATTSNGTRRGARPAIAVCTATLHVRVCARLGFAKPCDMTAYFCGDAHFFSAGARSVLAVAAP